MKQSIGYKLTTQDMTTHNGYQWQIGVKNTATGSGGLCTNGVLHYYSHPVLAVILNPIHANIKNPRLFEVEIEDFIETDGLKYGCKSQTLIREIELPVLSTDQIVEFAIRVVKKVCTDVKFQHWADNWLDGTDRSAEAAEAAARAAAGAAARAAWAAWAAAWAAEAAWAAWAAAEAAARAAAGAAEFMLEVLAEMDLQSLNRGY